MTPTNGQQHIRQRYVAAAAAAAGTEHCGAGRNVCGVGGCRATDPRSCTGQSTLRWLLRRWTGTFRSLRKGCLILTWGDPAGSSSANRRERQRLLQQLHSTHMMYPPPAVVNGITCSITLAYIDPERRSAAAQASMARADAGWRQVEATQGLQSVPLTQADHSTTLAKLPA